MSGLRRRSRASVLLGTTTGKLGVALLSGLVAISVLVLVTYPLDFGTKYWNNPSYWAEHPRAVPPSWISYLTDLKEVQHTILETDGPTSIAGTVKTYEFRVSYDFDEAPSFVTLSIYSIKFYGDRAPVLLFTVDRPDGVSATLVRYVVPQRREGEATPVVRFQFEPLRFYLDKDQEASYSLAQNLMDRYRLELDPTALSVRFEELIFGHPTLDRGNVLTFIPLKGLYVFRLTLIGGEERDQIGKARLVIGGTTFGLMGTDNVGRDLAVGLLFGFPVALLIGFMTSTLSTTIGTVLGLIGGYVGGRTDAFIQRVADVVANFPVLPLLIFLSFTFRPNVFSIMLLLVVFSWPGLTITVRSMVLQLKESPMIESARLIGASRWRIIAFHLFPFIGPYVLSQMIFFVPSAILAEAALSFLGLGDPTIPTWGNILELAFRTGAVFVGYWWWVIPPGVLLMLTSVCFVLLALGMEPVISPRLRFRHR